MGVVERGFRLVRFFVHPRLPPFPAFWDWGGWVGDQQVFPAQGAPSVLLGQQAHGVGVQGGFAFAGGRGQVSARLGLSGGGPPLTEGVV